MTTQKVSGLRAARNWMDSLGMRHYGEVDHALAQEHYINGVSGRPASGSRPEYRPWQKQGFARYATAALHDHMNLGNDLSRLLGITGQFASGDASAASNQWQRTVQAAKDLVRSNDTNVNKKFSVAIIGKKAVLENNIYKITAGGGRIDIYNKQVNESFTAWQTRGNGGSETRAPSTSHTSTFTLSDHTEAEIKFSASLNNQASVPALTVTQGSFIAEISGVDNYFGSGLTLRNPVDVLQRKSSSSHVDQVTVSIDFRPSYLADLGFCADENRSDSK